MTVFQHLFNYCVNQYIDAKRHDDSLHARNIAEIMIQADQVEQNDDGQFESIYQNWLEYRIAIEQLKQHNKELNRSIDFVLETLTRGANAKLNDLEWLFFKNFHYVKTVYHTDFLRRALNMIDYINVLRTAVQNAGVDQEPEPETETPQVQLT